MCFDPYITIITRRKGCLIADLQAFVGNTQSHLPRKSRLTLLCRINKVHRTMTDIFRQCIKLPVLNAASDMIFVFVSNKYACCAMACTSLAMKLHALMQFRSCLPL